MTEQETIRRLGEMVADRAGFPMASILGHQRLVVEAQAHAEDEAIVEAFEEGAVMTTTTTVHHDRWGPNGLAVEQVVRRASQLTADEVRRLASAWNAWTAPDPAESPADEVDMPWLLASDRWNDAEDALDAAASAAGRTDQAEAAAKAAEDAVVDAASAWLVVVGPAQANRAVFAASVAAFAVAAADLVGTGEFTADHLDLLLGPWRSVVGDLGEPVCECVEVR